MMFRPIAIGMVSVFSLGVVAHAGDIVRSGATSSLNVGTAWDGGIVPGSSDVAVWQLGSSAGSVSLGGDMSWGGIKISNLASTSLTISSGSTLTVGASGIDLSASAADLTLSPILNLGADQTWSVAAGRRISTTGNNAALTGLVGSGHLTLTGAGSFFLNSVNMTYSGGTTFDGATVVIGSTTAFGTGTVGIRNNVTVSADVDTTRTLASPIVFTGSANSLSLGTDTVRSRMTLSKGVTAGAAQRTISLKNSSAPSTSNIALTIYAGVGEVSTAAEGGSLVLANGNATPSVQPVWVLMGSTGGNDFIFNGELTIGTGVEAYFRASSNLGANTALTVRGTLDVSAKSASAISPTIKSLVGDGVVTSGRTSAGTNTLTIDGGASTGVSVFSGTIQNGPVAGAAIAITKSGMNTQILAGANNYSGATTISGGALQASEGVSLPSASVLQLRGGVFQSSGTFNRTVSASAGGVNWGVGGGGFAAVGDGLKLQLNGGTASLSWNSSNFVSNGQSLVFGSRTATNLVDLQNGISLGTSGTNTRVISVIDNPGSDGDRARISGSITGVDALQKVGEGTLELSNAGNSYTGATVVNAGTLLVTGSISASSAITVNSGGNFSVGSGVNLSNEITVASGGRIGGSGTYSDGTGIILVAGAIAAPGNSPGNTTYNTDLTFNSNSLYEWELGAYGTSAGIDSDLLTVSGAGNVLTFDAGSLLTLNFLSPVLSPNAPGAGDFWLSNKQWLLADAASGGVIVDNGLLIQAPTEFSNGSFSISSSGGDLYLNYVIPEPTTTALVSVGFGIALLGCRQRRRSVAEGGRSL